MYMYVSNITPVVATGVYHQLLAETELAVVVAVDSHCMNTAVVAAD